MGFFTRASGSGAGLPPEDVALMTAVVTLLQTGDFTDLDRRCIGLFRDEFPRLSPLDDAAFQTALEGGVSQAKAGDYAANAPAFVTSVVVPNLASEEDRGALYQFVYALAMTDLNLNEGETSVLQALRQSFGNDQATFDQAEESVLSRYQGLYRAIAATALGLMVVTADGKAGEDELADIRSARSVLEPIAQLDDVQFNLVYDMSLVVHDRFLLDVKAREDFVKNIVGNLLQNREVRYQVFHYAAHIATADGDIAQAELDTLRLVLHALDMKDEAGDAIFQQYMDRVKTVDGKPR